MNPITNNIDSIEKIYKDYENRKRRNKLRAKLLLLDHKHRNKKWYMFWKL